MTMYYLTVTLLQVPCSENFERGYNFTLTSPLQNKT